MPLRVAAFHNCSNFNVAACIGGSGLGGQKDEEGGRMCEEGDEYLQEQRHRYHRRMKNLRMLPQCIPINRSTLPPAFRYVYSVSRLLRGLRLPLWLTALPLPDWT